MVVLASTQKNNIGDDKKDERSVMNALLYNLIQLGQPDYKTNYNCQSDNMNIGVNIANQFPNEPVISNHSNACNGNDDVLRTEIYYHFNSTNGKELALKFQSILKKYFPNRNIQILPDNRDYQSGFMELRETTAPAILVEWYYHDSLKDIMWYANNYNSIIKVLCEFIGLTYPKTKTDPIKQLDWLTILNKSKLDKPQEWIIFFKNVVELAETNGDIGFLEKAKYLPTLIEKVYNNKV